MLRLLPLTLIIASGPALAQTKDHAPAALPSSSVMTHDRGESWTYVKPKLDLHKYRSVMLEPTVVYSGADAQFDNIPRADRQRFATIVTDELRAELGKAMPLVQRAGPDTARLQVTLLGVEGTKGGLATATRVMPIGFAVSAVKSLAGKPGSLTGSMLFAVELTDATSGELEVAAVRRRTPDALDIGATLSTSDTVKSVARDFARNVSEKLAPATGRSR
jgi:Protein of unknown function (DUF3313)